MNSCRTLWLAVSLAFLFVISGCGGSSGDKFNPNNVSVTVSPASANVAVGGQVPVQATVNNDCSGCAPSVLWSIQEMQVNGATGAQCNWSGSTPPDGPCPYGTIEGTETTSVTFHAPSTTGTVHVEAEWTFISNPPISKTATSAITVQ